jgi:DNA ligase-associated metallophosphoesterase
LIKTFNNQQFLLSPDKVLVHVDSNTGFVADLHLGKTAHFRKAGIAIPTAIINEDLSRLEYIIDKYQLTTLFFLGDLFHAQINHEWEIFKAFLRDHKNIAFILIKGNHDILPEKEYILDDMQVEAEPFRWLNFLLSHHPISEEILSTFPKGFNLAGHIHPGGIIKGKARTSLRLAAFIEKKQQLVLPAFGRFTGLQVEHSKDILKRFLIGGDLIIEQAY